MIEHTKNGKDYYLTIVNIRDKAIFKLLVVLQVFQVSHPGPTPPALISPFVLKMLTIVLFQ